MADLTTPEGIKEHLSDTRYRLTSALPLSGGFANFVYRGTLAEPLDGGVKTVAIKYSAPFAVWRKDEPFDDIRSVFEYTAMSSIPHFDTPGIRVSPPQVYYYDEKRRVSIQEDAGPTCQNLKAILITDCPWSEETARRVGTALGSFLSQLHAWGRSNSPDANTLREKLSTHTLAIQTWLRVMYGELTEIIDMYPSLPSSHRATLEKAAEKAFARKDPPGIAHGDYWTGNVLLDGLNPEKALIVDWEMSKEGGVWGDIGQMCAELWLPFHFRGTRVGLAALDAFLRTYDLDDEETAKMAIAHFGVHITVWPSRIPGWGDADALEACVKIGLEFIQKAQDGDWAWVKQSVLSGIVKDAWL